MPLGSFLLGPALLAVPHLAPDPPVATEDEEPVTLGTLVVTPTGGEGEAYEAPYTVQSVPSERIEERAYRTLPQALRDVPGVLVQETSHGQGSPYIRGFTSRRTLMLLDGIRLNNSVFREGPNQYWNTVDPLSLERLEVVKGPSSALYGSDAIGGTVNAIPRTPMIWDRALGGRVYARYADGEEAFVGRVEAGGAVGEDTAWAIGINRKDFGDVEAGDPTGEQPMTGYEEWDGDVRVEHHLGEGAWLEFAHYDVNQNDVPRTHRTDAAVPFEGTDVGSDRRRDFDHDRTLTYLRLNVEGQDVTSRTTMSFHRQQETRFRTRSNGAEEQQGFDVGTVGFQQQFSQALGDGLLTYGIDWYHDDVDSFLEKFADQSPADDIQGPVADDATYDLLGVYAQDEMPLGDATTLTLGARLTYAAADAKSVRDPVTDERISLDDDWTNLAGTVRLSHALDEDDTTRVFAGLSQGFRAPNLADLTRFDSASTNEFEIPAPDLDPEDFLQAEVGVKHDGERLGAQASVFYTWIEDLIQRIPTGNTNAMGEIEVTKANQGDGQVWGAEVGAALAVDEEWSVFGDVAYVEGEVDTIVDAQTGIETTEYLSRLMPLTARAGVRWEPAGTDWWGEAAVVRAQDADKLSPRDERDSSRIPEGGTPGYTVVDLRGGWSVNEDVDLTFGVENVTDEDYRVHGSGSNRVGRNLYFGIGWSF